MLRLYLFGAPRLEVNGKAMAMRRSKALALLAYLGVTKQPHERDTLLGLLWPEFDAASARNNLRRELSILRSTLGDQVLITQGQQIAWNPQPAFWLDVAEFQAQLAASRSLQPNSEPWAAALTAAVALAGEEFLAGFSLPESSGFDDWQFFQREELRQHLSEALEALSGWHQERAEYSSGSAFARRWLALDPLHEPARRMLMELYARSGQTTAALRCYEEGVALLEAELGAAPDDATTALNTAIKARRLAPAPPESPLSSAAAPARSSLDEAPLPLTSFIGRHAELQDLIAQLCDPNCRLLSVVGPGGIGKTRLALEVTARLGTSCTAGAVFVALQGASSPIHIPGAIARALDLTLSGDGDPWNRLAHLLRERELMLVLDNFEHVSDGAPWLAALLHAAPKLKLLVTSREALKLQEEWLYPLGGLGLPDAESDFEAGNTDAVQLFVARARQNRRNFSPADDYDQIARICHMVGGMPLAIELAAAWIATLSCAEIAAAIAHNLTFLETSMRNLPARHRSVMVVFDQTWAQLDRDVQRVLMRLSMLPGGFTSEAAAAIAGATPALLARLLDQALLRRDSGGRYRFHELIRQYAARHLQNSGEFASEVWESCGRYYGQFLAGLHELYERGEDRRAIVMLEVERDNFRSAWPAILAQTADEPLRELLQGVQAFYLVRGPYQEGLDLLGVAETKLRAAGAEFAAQRVLAHVLTNIGFIHIRVGAIGKAAACFEESSAIFKALGVPPAPGDGTDPQIGAGIIALIQGDYHAANRHAEQLRLRSEAHGLTGNLVYAWYLFTEVSLAQQLLPAARRNATRALIAAKAARSHWFSAYILNQLGRIALALGRFDEADEHFHTCYTTREAYADVEGMALALVGQAESALRRADFAGADARYTRGLELYRQIGDRGGIAHALVGLGAAEGALGNYRSAWSRLREALAIATELEYQHVVLDIVANVAQLLIAAGHPEAAIELLTPTLSHPAGRNETARRVQRLLIQCEESLPAVVFDAAAERGRQLELTMAIQLLDAYAVSYLGGGSLVEGGFGGATTKTDPPLLDKIA